MRGSASELPSLHWLLRLSARFSIITGFKTRSGYGSSKVKHSALRATPIGCPDLRTIVFEIWLKNTGAWPIENVRLMIQKTVYTINLNDTKNKSDNLVQFSFDAKDMKPYPPLAISVDEKHKHDIVVHFKDSLPPNSDVMLVVLQFKNVSPDYIHMFPDFETMQPLVWVSSEVSSFDLYWGITVDCSTVKRLRQQSAR